MIDGHDLHVFFGIFISDGHNFTPMTVNNNLHKFYDTEALANKYTPISYQES
jgi:hypothetical protein